MKFRPAKITTGFLLLSSIFILAAFSVFVFARIKIKTPYYKQQVGAAKKMMACIDSLSVLPIPAALTKNDPNQTNLIGSEYSAITTTLGDLSAKRTSTNPDFAALVVRWFSEMELETGDVVAVGCSGSFPALTLVAICAAEVMDLKPIIICSLGASSFGANRANFTYLDIEKYLFEKKLIYHRSSAASLGGGNDCGEGLSEEGTEILKHGIERSGTTLIHTKDLVSSVSQRIKIYTQASQPKVFVNIGGAQVNVGDYNFAKNLMPGINRFSLPCPSNPGSMVEYFAGADVPVIHLLNIRLLAQQYGIIVDPKPLPEIGLCPVYYEQKVTDKIWIISISLCLIGCAILVWERK